MDTCEQSSPPAPRAAGYVWAAVLPTGLLGLVVAAGTWWQLREVEVHDEALHVVMEHARQLQAIERDTAFWSTTALSAIEAGTLNRTSGRELRRQGDRARLEVERLRESAAFPDLGDRLTELAGAVDSIATTLESAPPAGRGAERSPVAKQAISRITLEVERLRADVVRRVQKADERMRLATQRAHGVIGALVAGYFLVVFALLRWSLRSLVGPVARLTVSARRAHTGEAVEILRSGPAELRELSAAFSSLVRGLNEAREEIEHKARERAAVLIAANRARTEFLANMSHEIRTPMTAILGYLDALSDPAHSVAERELFLQTIRRNGQHLLKIINDILDVSKLDAGLVTVECIECDALPIVVEVVELVRGRAREKGLALELELRGRLPTSIQSDPTRLRQILVNLVGNAVKFTDRGEVRVSVWLAARSSDENAELCFEIADTGIGIAPDQLDVLFEPFSQGDSSHTRRYGGTGLGLAISRQLSRLLGADLSVESEVGLGSRFVLRLDVGPLRALRLEDPDLARHAPRALELAPLPHLRGRVLLAEDGADNQRLISMILAKLGLVVELAADGRSAVEQALRAQELGEPYDVILMDIQMPELDGYAATAELRRAGYRHPIVALTAHAMREDRQRCLESGCDEYLTKPIDRSSLVEVLRRFVEKAALMDLSTEAP